MKINPHYVTKAQLNTDYVTKREFGEFREEMIDFRDETRERFSGIDERFTGIDKRLDNIDRKLSDLKEDMRIQMGAWRDQLRADFQVGIEYMKDIAAGRK